MIQHIEETMSKSEDHQLNSHDFCVENHSMLPRNLNHCGDEITEQPKQLPRQL